MTLTRALIASASLLLMAGLVATRVLDPAPVTGVTQAVNEFSLSLFSQVSQENGDKNVFLSPLSVSTALSVLLLGARSSTADELSKGLHYEQLAASSSDQSSVHQQLREVRQTLPRLSLPFLLSRRLRQLLPPSLSPSSC